jgi:hypothetical protein
MATTYYTDIQKLYVAYFNRPADVAGQAYWETVVEAAKGDTTAVSAAFAAEAEYNTVFAGMSNAQIVDKVYMNLFGRPAEAAGKAYWADLLDKKAITIDKVVTEIAHGAQGTDGTAYANKVTAAAAFTTALDLPAEQAGYNAASISLAKDFISSVTTDASLTAAIAPAALNATVAKLVVAGTPFTVVTALQALDTANDAKAAFLEAYDGDVTAPVAEAEVGTAVSAAITKIGTMVTGYDASTASVNVRAALLQDKLTANATALATHQTVAANASADIAKIAGLSSAVATFNAAETALAAATTAETGAKADLAAKAASYNVLNSTATATVVVTVAADGTATSSTDAGVTNKSLIVADADQDGKLVLATGVTEAKNPGVTALLGSSVSLEAANATVVSAAKVDTAALAAVHYLDQSAAEVTDLTNIATKINAAGDFKIAAGAQPTEAQIATQQKILDQRATAEVSATGPAHTEASDFAALVTTYHADAVTDPLVAALKAANDVVKADQTAITNLTKAVDALTAANTDAAQLKALNDTIAADIKVFVDHDLAAPSTLDGTAVVATAASDIYVAGDTGTSISLFGLLGTDSLYIGSDYVLNTGKLTTGNNAALEAFVAQAGNDTTIKLETSVFGSNAAAPEVVTITLVGVDATHVHLSNGIITVA